MQIQDVMHSKSDTRYSSGKSCPDGEEQQSTSCTSAVSAKVIDNDDKLFVLSKMGVSLSMSRSPDLDEATETLVRSSVFLIILSWSS